MNITHDQKELILAALTGENPDTFFPKLINEYIFPKLEALDITPEDFKSGDTVVNEGEIALKFMIEIVGLMKPDLSEGEILASLNAQDLLACKMLVNMTVENIIFAVALNNAQGIYAEGEARGLDHELKELLDEQ